MRITFPILSMLTTALLLSSCGIFSKTDRNHPISTTEDVRPSPVEGSITPATTGKIQTIKAEQFKKLLLLDNIQLVDVRTKEEYQAGHIKDAMNMDVQNTNFKSNINKLDKSKPVLVYCRSGKRSINAAEIMKENGFTKIVNLEGGILSWEEAELPISK